MHIIVIGAGEVGKNIVRHMVRAGHEVVLIDPDASKLERIAETLDIQTIVGLGCRPVDLDGAGAGHADMLVAVSRSDEVNMVACQMAYSLHNVPRKIARVRDPSYLKLQGSHVYSADNMPVDVIISPELEVAKSVHRTLHVPGAFEVYPMADGHLQLLGIAVDEKSPLRRMKLAQWPNLNVPFRALLIIRQDRAILPTRSDHLEEGDELYVLVAPSQTTLTLELLGKTESPISSAMILGGGNVGLHLSKLLEFDQMNVRILEQNEFRAVELADMLAQTTVLQGDALDRDLLIQENLAQMDACLAVTSSDSANILASIQARQLGVKNILTLIHGVDYVPIGEAIGLEKIISPQQVTVSKILQAIRQEHIYDIHTLRDGFGEVIEVELPTTSTLCGRPLTDLGLPQGARLGAVIRPNGDVIFPSENIHLHGGDRMIFYANSSALRRMDKLLGR